MKKTKGNYELSAQIILFAQVTGDKDFKLEPESEKSFIISVLKKKIEYFELPIKITKFAYLLIDLYSEGNPGFAQYILYRVIEQIKDKEDKIITVNDIVNTWPWEAPLIDKDYENWWDSQKINGCNSVDIKEFWIQAIA